MTPDQILQSLELQSQSLKEQINLMPVGSAQRQSAEQILSQYDAQLVRVKDQYKKQGQAF